MITEGEFGIFVKSVGLKPFTALLRGDNPQPGVPGTSGPVLLAVGTMVPAAGGDGYGKGCVFIQTHPVTAKVIAIFVNGGTAAACDFNRAS